MKDLKCGLKECTHNKGYSCCANNIEVNTFTDCLTYSPQQSKRSTMFEAASDFTPANYSVDTFVKCTAKCVFNKENRCMSNGITIMGAETNEATCLTYIKD